MTMERDGADAAPEFTAGAVTLCDVLRRRGERQDAWRGYTFLLDGEAEEAGLTYGELDRRARAVAARLQSLGAQGERVLLLYPPGLEYVTAVFGCFYAGAVPILAFPPRLNRPTPRVQAIVADARPKIAMTVASIFSDPQGPFHPRPRPRVPGVAGIRRRLRVRGRRVAGAQAQPRQPGLPPVHLGLHRHSQGRDGEPRQRAAQPGAAPLRLRHRQGRDRSALWLPLYHDMGLIGGILQAALRRHAGRV